MKKFLFIIILISGSVTGQQTEAEKYILAGNQFYQQQRYEQAVAEYVKALQVEPGNSIARFNHANALYKAGQQVEAAQKFTELSASSTDKAYRNKTFYNKGVILSSQKNLEESIEAYKNALRQDPNDKEARENLQKALLELKKKNPPQQNKQDQQNKNQQQKQQQSKMNQREAEQRLRLLEQKEREVQERLQKEKARSGGGTGKDW